MKKSALIYLRLMLDALLGLGRGSKVAISMLGDLLCMGAAFSIVMLKASATQSHAAPSDGLGWWFVFSALAIAFAWRLGLYRAVLRYAGVRVLWVVGLSVALASLGLGLVQSLYPSRIAQRSLSGRAWHCPGFGSGRGGRKLWTGTHAGHPAGRNADPLCAAPRRPPRRHCPCSFSTHRVHSEKG